MALIKYGTGVIFGTGQFYSQPAGTTLVPLDGTCTSHTSLSSKLSVLEPVVSSISSHATLSSELSTTKIIVSSTSSQGTFNGLVRRQRKIIGDCLGQLTTISVMDLKKEVSGAVTVLSGLSVGAIESKKHFTSEIASSLNIEGTENVHWNLFTTSILKYGPDKIFGKGFRYGQHQAVFSVVTAVSAVFNRIFKVSGSISSSSSCKLQSEISIDGTLEASSNFSARLTATIFLVPYFLAAAANFEGSPSSEKKFGGILEATSNVAGLAKLVKSLSSTLESTSFLTSSLLNLQESYASLNAISNFSGLVKGGKNLSGAISSSSSVTSSSRVDKLFFAFVFASSSISGNTQVSKKIQGSLRSTSTLSATPIRFKYLTGNLTCVSNFLGLIVPLKDSTGSIVSLSTLTGFGIAHWNLTPESLVKYGLPVRYGVDRYYGQRIAILSTSNVNSRAKAFYSISGLISSNSLLELQTEIRIDGQVSAISDLSSSLNRNRKLWDLIYTSADFTGSIAKCRTFDGMFISRSALNAFLKVFKHFEGNLNVLSFFDATLERLKLLDADILGISEIDALLLRLKVLLGSIISAQAVFGLMERFEPIVADVSVESLAVEIFTELLDIQLSELRERSATPALTQIESTPTIFDLDVSIAAVA